MRLLKSLILLLALIFIASQYQPVNRETEFKTVKLEYNCFMNNGQNFCNN